MAEFYLQQINPMSNETTLELARGPYLSSFPLWSNDLGDALLAFAFYCIAVLLLYFLYRRPDAQYRRIFFFFGLFILGCGTVSALSVVTSSDVGTVGVLKIATGGIALCTVGLLLLNFKDILYIPSQRTLQDKNDQLIHEIRQRQQTAASLQQQEASTQFILRHAVAGVATFNREGIFTKVNEVLADMLGYSPEDLIGRPYQSITHPADLERDAEISERFYTDELSEHQWEKRFIHADGRAINILMLATLVKGEQPNLDIWIAQVIDISDRVEQERQLRERGDALERAISVRTKELRESNENLEYFIYAITHDLRQPLKNLESLVDVLVSEDPNPEEEKVVKKLLRNNATRMDELITDLLSFSRTSQEELHLEEVDPNPMVEEILETRKHQYRGHQIITNVETLPLAYGDPAAVQLIWDNLISNAFKYSSKEPQICVHIDSVRKGDFIIYCIRDEGVGFDEKYKHKLFGLFQRLHPAASYRGTGIGLAVVHRMVLRQGGAIWAESKPGEGATFYFSLPSVSRKTKTGSGLIA